MNRITILLADDHPIVRQGIRSLIESTPEFEVIGEASDGIEAIDMIEKKSPDIAFLDIMMPNLNGLEVTKQVSKRKFETKIIILSMYANSTYAVRALRNGASGYVLKDSKQSEIINAVHAVMNGQRFISPEFSDEVFSALIDNQNKEPDNFNQLTTRERQVLQMIAEGNTNKEIAEKLVLSTRTIESHRANLMIKLKINSQAKLVQYAIQKGLISIDPPIDII